MQPYTRRGLLLGTAATLTTAGCLGGDTDGGEQGTTTTASSTTTETMTTLPSTPTSTAEPASMCAPWNGATTTYDVAGTPLVFAYDYVETWTPSEISDTQGYLQRLTSPPVGDNDVTMTTRISLNRTALTASERDEEIQFRMNLDSEPRVVVDEISYDGESLQVLGLREEDIAVYPPGYSVFLPHGSGADRRYYAMGVTTFGGLQVPEAEQSVCIDAIDEAQWTIVRSLRPNPETTFDDA